MASKKSTKIEAEAPVLADETAGEESKQGYEAWLMLQPKIEARAGEAKGVKTLSVNYAVADRTIRGLMPEVRALLPAVLKEFSPARKEIIQRAAADVELSAQAARFVAGQLKAAKAEGVVKEAKERRADREELTALRKLGLDHLAVCVTLGHMEPETAEQIRSGRGLLDAAQDCERMGMLFKELWSALEPMQAHQRDPQRKLTLAKVERMIALGGQVANAIHTEGALRADLLNIDWKKHMLGVGLLLDEQWSALHDALTFYARTIKDKELADRLPLLRGMRG
jgi:hypothetical protein